MKIDKDNFVWKLLSPGEARDLFLQGTFDVYALEGDDTEHMIETIEELNELADNGFGVEFGLEVGYIEIKPLKKKT